MANKYAIKVTEITTDRASGNVAMTSGWVVKFDQENDFLITSTKFWVDYDFGVAVFDTVDEIEKAIDELPVRRCGANNSSYEYEINGVNTWS
jgi:hypothetical protein